VSPEQLADIKLVDKGSWYGVRLPADRQGVRDKNLQLVTCNPRKSKLFRDSLLLTLNFSHSKNSNFCYTFTEKSGITLLF
jgi:hypothetical protein